MPPPHKSKDPLQPEDTSSQVSAEMAEASLEGIPPNISPIAAASRPKSVTLLVDPMELWGNANKALKELLTTKASIDAHRQRSIWVLGMELCQNESQATKSTKEAKAVCSWKTLDAKTAYSVAVKKAKTTQACIILEAKAACLPAIRDVKAQRASQAKSLQREHGNVMWNLEEQVIREERRAEVKLTSSLPGCPVCQPTRVQEHSGCFLPHFIGADTSITPICSIAEGFPSGRTACFSHSSHTSAQTVS